jgi:FimV-like protein
MQTGSKQLLLIAGAAILTAALYFAPKQLKKENVTEEVKDIYSFESLLAEAKGQISKEEAEKINSVEAELSKDQTSMELTDSLGKLWDAQNFPQISSHYFEKIALIKQDEGSWVNAAYRYFDAFRVTNDSILRSNFVGKAISAYQKVLEINPENLNAKTDLGLCYAEGTSNPMQGIMMLREVVAKNPEHEMAQFNLGILSVKSGQYDKAVERFNKVLEINPSNYEARYMLGRTYSAMGKNDLALESLEKVKNSGNPRLTEEANNLVKQINNN